MHMTMFRKPSLHVSTCKTRLTIAMAFCFSLFACSVSAQWAVIDAANITTNQQGFASQLAKTIDQYVKQGLQYEKQIQQYEQMLTKVENLGTNFQILPNAMTKIDADPLIQANCSGSSGSIVGNLLSSVTSLLTQSTAKSQQQICAQIVTTQVDKYNATVDLLDSITANTSALQKLGDLTSSFTNAGESSSAATQAAGYSNQMATEMNDWSAHMKADDAIIGSLQDMQSTLARSAMNAKPSLGGEAVQAAVLTAAFTYHPSL